MNNGSLGQEGVRLRDKFISLYFLAKFNENCLSFTLSDLTDPSF